MKQFKFGLIFILLAPLILRAQEDERNWRLYGYVKDMVSFNFPEQGDSSLVDNLVHNRLNFSWFPSENFTTQIEVRTRLFNGDLVKTIPQYGEFIDVNDDYFDLSTMPVNENNIVLHSMIDRAYIDWKQDKWSLRVGRQRINWGINMVWNPNDIFNAYNFFDFDYEERPGSDAIRFQRYIGFAGGIEVAVKAADDWKEFTGAALYKWNKWNYDMQVLTGVMRNNVVLGGGWAGNIGLAGFKGEMTYFHALDDEVNNEFLGTISFDYSFPNSLYFNVSGLYNSNGSDSGGLELQSSANLDVRSLSPYKWSTFFQSTYSFHPLLNGGMSVLYFVDQPGTFLGPFITWSIIQNLDLDLIGQFYLNAEPQSIRIIYTRIKYSF